MITGMQAPALLIVAVLGFPRTSSAGEVPSDTSSSAIRGTVRIESDVDSALVILDGHLIGFTPLVVDTLQAGTYSVKLLHPDKNNWLTESIFDSFIVHRGESVTRRYVLETRYLVRSDPFNAEVFLRDSLIGRTPLVIRKEDATSTTDLLLRKQGYEDTRLGLVGSERGVVTAALKRTWYHEGTENYLLTTVDNGKRFPSVRVYLTGVSTVFSGAAAAYFKIKADKRYQSYLTSRDPSVLSETHRLDRAAAVALVAAQISIGLFAYFLLSE